MVKKNILLRKKNFCTSGANYIVMKNKKETFDIDTVSDWNLAIKFFQKNGI